jgi:hypothetical protein
VNQSAELPLHRHADFERFTSVWAKILIGRQLVLPSFFLQGPTMKEFQNFQQRFSAAGAHSMPALQECVLRPSSAAR